MDKRHSSGSGEIVLVEKSKKARIRKLSAIGGAQASSSFEMVCHVFGREDEELHSKRFKLPRKCLLKNCGIFGSQFLGDCNGVHLGSVPRKLRSAMKKRHRQSASLDCNGVKRPCLKQGDGFRKETVSGPITKDEEEVAETLYALAGLVFPSKEVNVDSKVDSECFDADVTELKNSPTPAVEVGDIKLDPVLPRKAASSNCPSFVEGLAKGIDQVDLLNKPSTHYQPELSNSGKFCTESDNNSLQSQINISSLSAKVEECKDKPFGVAVNFRDPSELSLDSRLKQTVQQQTSVFGRKPEIAVELGTNIGIQVQEQNMLQEPREKGSGLWPGLSTNVSHGARRDSPAATLPPWMDAPCSISKAPVSNGSPFVKVTKLVNGRRSCKKCAVHVYISHLIQSLKSSENQDKLMLQPSQITHEGSRQGAFLGAITNVQSGLNEAVSSSSISVSTAQILPHEAKNSILQNKKFHQDQPSSTLASGARTSPKEVFDFLSLSAGGGSSENNDRFSRAQYGMGPLSQAQVPYLHPKMQHHNLIPFSLNGSHYNSSAPLDNPSMAQQGQLLHSYGNPFYGPQANAIALTKQQIQQQQFHLQKQQQFHLQQQHQSHLQQQQQRLWAAQYRPAGTIPASAPSPSWQSIKQDKCTLIQCGQALYSPPRSTFELVDSKYAPLSQHQQQLMAVTSSFPPGSVKRPDHHLSSVHEDSVGGYRAAAASALPLQLLCNERL
ncbi:uncharacterized protein LOC126782556 isoform X2 [Argentina anserina]|uniref:uncharacterized protein LOC126782556 isoform X2 n=1 Tax=Argentina anserina TaxID=57926 RepID=UPI0021763E4B|nr:uncharacterized protein LOC126782556 isoform X2 [Potentilla anserina]